jgi:hypothetical protein
MLEQLAIYELAQGSFKEHHPKFPFPKKHNLNEQTDDFKRAFLAMCVGVNAMHEREMNILTKELGLARAVINNKINSNSLLRDSRNDETSRADTAEERLSNMTVGSVLGWVVVTILFGVIVVSKLNS